MQDKPVITLRRRLELACENANLSLLAGNKASYLRLREEALRLAYAIARRADA